MIVPLEIHISNHYTNMYTNYILIKKLTSSKYRIESNNIKIKLKLKIINLYFL